MPPIPKLEPDEIADDEILSQRISRGPDSVADINQPRLKDQERVSVIRSRKTPEEAYRLVRKGGTPGPDDGVRYVEAGMLREAGFVVTHTPNNKNVDHTSVTYPGDWDEDVALLFKTCFVDSSWHEVVKP